MVLAVLSHRWEQFKVSVAVTEAFTQFDDLTLLEHIGIGKGVSCFTTDNFGGEAAPTAPVGKVADIEGVGTLL